MVMEDNLDSLQKDKKGVSQPSKVDVQGDSSYKCNLTDGDLSKITLLEGENMVNRDLFVVSGEPEMDNSIFNLFSEGTISGVATGRETGIYKYKPIRGVQPRDEFAEYEDLLKTPIISQITGDTGTFLEVDTPLTSVIAEGLSQEEYDTSFTQCMLAQYDPFGGPQTQVVRTFRGYLEIARPFGVLRSCNYCTQDIDKVYIPEYYIDKYLLRNGDEVACVYTENRGKFVVESLLSINGEVYSNWNVKREWFNDIVSTPKKIGVKSKNANICVDMINTLELRRGDNVFAYLNDGSREAGWVASFVHNLNAVFDRVVVINPKVRSLAEIVEADNVVNFCAGFADALKNQIMVCVMGANYVKRLVELGKTVAFVVDDLNFVASLDNSFNGETPVTKTVFSCIKANKKGGAIMFGVVPFENPNSAKFVPFKSFESVALIVDKGELDLFASYRL